MTQTFPIAPASGGWLPLALLVLVVVLLASAPLVGVGRSVLGASSAQFEVSETALQLRGDWWGRAVPLDSLQVDRARIVDLGAEPALRPVHRNWGTGLPGYSSGWFDLASGEQALLYLTDQERAVYVPTDLGYSLLLSPRDPDAFLAALRGPR